MPKILGVMFLALFIIRRGCDVTVTGFTTQHLIGYDNTAPCKWSLKVCALSE